MNLIIKSCSYRNSTTKRPRSKANPFKAALRQKCFPRILTNISDKVFIGPTPAVVCRYN